MTVRAKPSPMQSYYAARAGEYDTVYQKPERQADLRQIEQWLPTVLAGETVLEVACGTGYWTQFLAPVASSIVAIDAAPETLRGLNSALEPGARVVLLDNLFVANSSSAIAEQDPSGNTYQLRKLGDGSTHRVLKNFPSEAQLRALVEAGRGESAAYRTWQFYWALEYRVPEP